jgi:AmmeMemoRadiSam system protein B
VAGPAHRVPVRGLALSSADGFATPLGVVPVDRAANLMLLDRPGVYLDDRAHAQEHSIEVHVPFLQRSLGDGWSLVPIVAGNASAAMVAEALDQLWGEPGTLIVISSDLSHYHDASTARQLDADTATAIVAAEWETLDGDDACGVVPLCGALVLARDHGEHIELLDLRNSGDTAGPSDRVVGYGSFLVR